MTTRFSLTCSVIALALTTTPLVAQQRPQDFSLPPGPTPTPTAEGPVDDRSGVPIGPRVIPTATPTPAPDRSPEPEATQDTAEPIAPAGQRPPSPRRTMEPGSRPDLGEEIAAEPAAPPASSQPGTDSTEDQLPGFTFEPAVPASQGSSEVSEIKVTTPLPEWLPWAAGLLGALFAGGLGGWFFARRRNAQAAPRIERTMLQDSIARAATGDTAVRPHISIEITQLIRSLMMLTLHYRITISNRSGQPLRDVKLAADLISSSRALPTDQQLANLDTQLPQAANIERIGPNQTTVATGTLQLPLNTIEVFRQGDLPLCLPLLRLRVEADGIGPEARTYLVGTGSANSSGRVHPLPLAGPPGSYDNVRTRPLDGMTA